MPLLVRRTGGPQYTRRVLPDELADHPEGAGFPLWLLSDGVDPVDPVVPVGLSGRGVGDDRAKRATFSSHSGD